MAGLVRWPGLELGAPRQQYYLHNFLPEQPDLNVHRPAVQDALLDIARFWLDLGVDGFRLDVANYYTHDLALRDNPPRPGYAGPRAVAYQQRIHNISQPETLPFRRGCAACSTPMAAAWRWRKSPAKTSWSA